MLYHLSDLMFYIVYYLARYRREVVRENLKNSFPEKSPHEITSIERKFYHHLCDLIIESFKGFAISDLEILKRHKFMNPEVIEARFKQGKRVLLLGSHYCNWEWDALSLPLFTNVQTYGVYQPLTNEFMNRVMKVSRERNGMKLISLKEVSKTLQETQNDKMAMGYFVDQSPGGNASRYHWMNFLNQDTAAIAVYEYLAKKVDIPVIYTKMIKTKRGHYESTFIPITDEPRTTKDGFLVETYMRILEKTIQEKPEYWLWSHRRWKIKRAATGTSSSQS